MWIYSHHQHRLGSRFQQLCFSDEEKEPQCVLLARARQVASDWSRARPGLTHAHIVLCEAQRAAPGCSAQEVSVILTGEAQESHRLRGVGGAAQDPGD